MGNFEDHMRYGVGAYLLVVGVGGILTGYSVYKGMDVGVDGLVLWASASVLGFPFALLGAGFPDIDHGDAKPHRYLKKWLSVGAAVVAGYLLFVSEATATVGGEVAREVGVEVPETGVALAGAVVGGVLAGVGARLAVDFLKPKHRGVTHTLGAGFVVAALVGGVSGYAGGLVAPPLRAFVGGICATSFFVGFLSHLQCDGLLLGVLPDETA